MDPDFPPAGYRRYHSRPDPPAWAGQLGQALARIHAMPARSPRPNFRRCSTGPTSTSRPSTARLPAWSGPAGKLSPAAPAVLTHYDFWSGNTIVEGGILTGVVDWSAAPSARAGFDVGWCRLDLYLLYGEHIAG